MMINLFLKIWEVDTGQPAIRCSKLTIETVEQDVKYVVKYANDVVLVSLLLTLNIFQILF